MTSGLVNVKNSVNIKKYEIKQNNVKTKLQGLNYEYENIDYSIQTQQNNQSKLQQNENITLEEAKEKAKDEQKKLELENQKKASEEEKKKQQQLEQLYIDREDNNGLFNSKKEKEIEKEILKLEKELGVEHKADGWEKFSDGVDIAFDYAATAVGSVTCGILEVVENIGDGLIMAGGAIASGVVTLAGNEELAAEIKQGTTDIISYDWTEAAYGAYADALGIDEDIAYGAVHTVGTAIGTTVGYVALSMVPGGAAVATVSGGLAAAGSSAENAFNSGATFEEALVVSAVAAAGGTVSGGLLNKAQGTAAGAKTIKGVVSSVGKGALSSAVEPVANSVTEYVTYANDMTDENGNKLYDNFEEYYVESGGLLNTAIAGTVGGVSTGIQGLNGMNDTNIKLVDDLSQRTNNLNNKIHEINYNEQQLEYDKLFNSAEAEVHYVRNDAIDNLKKDKWVSMDISEDTFKLIVSKADEWASKYEEQGVMDKKTFYEIWGTPKGNKPEPSTYLSKEYIETHLSKFYDGGSRITADVDFIKYKHATEKAGIPIEYKIGGEVYKNGSELISPSGEIDSVIDKAIKSKDMEGSICYDLALMDETKYKLKVGMKRYDIDGTEISELNPRIPNGNEPSATPLYWIPGGYTLGGVSEIVIDSYKFNSDTIRYSNINKGGII